MWELVQGYISSWRAEVLESSQDEGDSPIVDGPRDALPAPLENEGPDPADYFRKMSAVMMQEFYDTHSPLPCETPAPCRSEDA